MMNPMQSHSSLDRAPLPSLYRNTVLSFPAIIVALLALLLCFFIWQARNFSLDASADALLLENDEDLRIYRATTARYGSAGDSLVVTYDPPGEIFTQDSLDHLATLRDELTTVDSVESVFSVLEVPLLTSSGVSLTELTSGVPTLETHPYSDLEKVKTEITTSPVFQDLIVSEDGTTTGMLLNLSANEKYSALREKRSALRLKDLDGTLSPEEKVNLLEVNTEFDQMRSEVNKKLHDDIAAVRTILARHEDKATMHLGGVPMVSDDMITYIARDLVVFGAGVVLFILATLTFIFRRMRWVLLPVASCLFAGMTVMGFLGLIGWKVTVISSNFISLMFIITMSMNIHLVVRFRQLKIDHPGLSHIDRVWLASRKMFWPCLYTALTTIIGFSSLVFSGIKPVIDFGWMMSIGLVVTFLTSFLLFPSLLVLIGPLEDDGEADKPVAATALLARFTDKRGNWILILAVLLAIMSAVGISRLIVENSFINYFRSHTEIYQGMKLIDDKLGGTTPLDIVLDLTEEEEEDECADLSQLSEEDAEFCEELALLEGDSDESEDLWFTPYKVNRVKEVHDYLESIPSIGKVLSVASILRTGEAINDNKEFTPFELELLFKNIPEDLRGDLIDPYLSIENNEARISMRILDSLPDLRRRELLEKIRYDIENELNIPTEQFQVSGILVLYNNMLQSLFQSQIQTIGAVLLGIAIMFLILFRSLTLAIIGIIPNALAAAIVLGIMGLAKLPLDMMTITIATISIGIAVDNSIHYIYRFKEELPKHESYAATLHTCHKNIGRAVLYTSLTIIFGFSILVFSNFIPTIYFGLLTALAMFVALLAVLTLLPKLILVFKPFGPAGTEHHAET